MSSTKTKAPGVVIEHEPTAASAMVPATGHSVMFKTEKQLKASLDRFSRNRRTLLRWLAEALIEGLDYGRIHIASPHAKNERFRCAHGARCTNDYHFSKKTLFKPGAEKICGMLGYTATWPALPRYEELAITGADIKHLILRCVLVDRKGLTVGEGVGGRDGKEDINKALKMCKKSGLIDAVLSTCGLSEIFTQDLDDMLAAPSSRDMFDEVDLCPIGPNIGRPLAALDDKALTHVLELSDDPDLRERIKALIDTRQQGGTPRSVADDVEDGEISDEITLKEAHSKVGEAFTVDELERSWKITPEKFKPALRTLYERKLQELDNG